MADEYKKGTVVQVFKTDRQGNPTSHVERDTDGDLWHVKAGDENTKPQRIRDEDLSSLAVEEAQRGGVEDGQQ